MHALHFRMQGQGSANGEGGAFGWTPTPPMIPPMMTRAKEREIRLANHEALRLLRELNGLERQYLNTLALLTQHRADPNADPEVIKTLEHYERVDRWDLEQKREELEAYLATHQ